MSKSTWQQNPTATFSVGTTYYANLRLVEAPEGYHWRHVKGKTHLVKNPQRGGVRVEDGGVHVHTE